MEKSQFEIPKSTVQMVSPRDFRLSSLTGFCVNFVANEPINVPPHVYLEALEIGARVAETKEATAPAAPEPEPTVISVIVMDPAKRSTDLDQAVMTVVRRNYAEDFKNDGTPKAAKVIAELDPEFDPRPSATEIHESYERLQSNLTLIDE